jgi:dTDP-glucose 4,6-dehydratase/UDP-glucuronate decarboxylase
MKSSVDVIETDLELLVAQLQDEFSRMSGSNVLVAGGAGFLGYYLVQAPLFWNRRNPAAAPISVTVLDNFVRGVPAWLTALEGDPHLRLLKHDITQPLPDAIGDQQYLIHAASIASPTYYRQYPIETMDANVGGLRHLLNYCLRQKEEGEPVHGVLFYSSSEIYGDPTPGDIPTPETYRGSVSCTGPRACYDESKRYGETLCVNFARQHGVPIKVARPFNNYGPGLKITDKRVIPDFARDILSGRDMVMLSDGAASRTFCYVADAVAGYYKVLVKGRPGEAYNVGVETPEISMLQLAGKLADLGRELFDYRGQVIHQESADKDYLVDNPNRRCPVITKARSELGYAPQVSLDEGLRRSLIWYSGNTEASEA